MARFRLTEPAEQDLLSLAAFISGEDDSAAERVVDAIESALRGLAEMPRKGHLRPDLTEDPSLRFWSVYSWFIVYRPRSKPLEVVRILHASRDVESELDA